MVRHFLTSLSVAALSVALAGPVAAQSVSGAYLAGRHAAVQSDFAAAAEYYGRALARDPQNVELMESAALSNLSLGTLDRAIPIARALSETNQTSQVAHMLMTADLVNVGHYEELLARETQSTGIGPLVDGLVKAWAHLGTGDLTQSLVAFDEMAEQPGMTRPAARARPVVACWPMPRFWRNWIGAKMRSGSSRPALAGRRTRNWMPLSPRCKAMQRCPLRR